MVESLLLEPVKAIIGALTNEAINRLLGGTNRNVQPLESALKVALGLAIHEYSTTGNKQHLAKPLLRKHGLLANKEVAAQLAAALTGLEAPDARVVGEEWRRCVKDPPRDVDFTTEAQALIGHFMRERRWVADSRETLELTVLEKLLENTKSIDGMLANLSKMLNEGFGIAGRRGLQHLRYDETALIEEHTREFVGRGWVLGDINQKLRTTSAARCLIIVRALPGVGKTALMARLVRDKHCVYHFNRRQDGGPTTLPKLLGNLCAQLIAKYQLDDDLSAGRHQPMVDSRVLADVLRMIQSHRPDPPPLIAIDALDEMDSWTRHGLAFLPEVPARFVISVRDDVFSRLPGELPGLDSTSHTIIIDPSCKKNKEDIQKYVKQQIADDGVRQYLRYHKLSENDFVEDIDHRSEGNFMYVRYVLHAIARGELRDRELKELPSGLKGYYATHVEQMRADDAAWEDYRLPIIAQLSALEQPLTIAQLSRSCGVSLENVTRALRGWGPFLKAQDVRFDDGRRRMAFSIYHGSFQEFLAADRLIGEYRNALLDRIADETLDRYQLGDS